MIVHKNKHFQSRTKPNLCLESALTDFLNTDFCFSSLKTYLQMANPRKSPQALIDTNKLGNYLTQKKEL